MQFDLDRISFRNMGRDNRIISDHGLSPRIPFLDEGLVHFLTQECPTWAKCCPFLGEGERGIGEKILLRAAAVMLFGPENVKVALFPKRAMQFGSRIAKLENSKEKGADSCDRLL
jgi:asparagine synthetase B (glutamine-hydrolysing)